MSFRLGHDHRLLRAANVADIAPVPFFLKPPGQQRGRMSDKPLRTVDVLPTVADAIGARIPWRIDGHSALEPTVRGQRRRRIISKKFHHVYPVDTPTYESDKRAALMRKLRLFPGRLDRVGPASGLIGRRLSELSVQPARAGAGGDPGRGEVPPRAARQRHRPEPPGGPDRGRRAGWRPCDRGRGERPDRGDRPDLHARGSGVEQFSLLIPERALRRGANRLEFLIARGTPRQPASGPVGGRAWIRTGAL